VHRETKRAPRRGAIAGLQVCGRALHRVAREKAVEAHRRSHNDEWRQTTPSATPDVSPEDSAVVRYAHRRFGFAPLVAGWPTPEQDARDREKPIAGVGGNPKLPVPIFAGDQSVVEVAYYLANGGPYEQRA